MELSPQPSQTPTLPSRHSYRRLYPQRLPTRPNTLSTLIPPPLCISKTPQTHSSPTTIIHVTVLEAPHVSTRPRPSHPQSPTPNPSTPSSSSSSPAPSSPPSSPRALLAPSYWSSCPSSPTPTPTPSTHLLLRRKVSPRRETLRALRIRDSEMRLQRVYDEQTAAYLHGGMFARVGLGLGKANT